MRSSVFMVEERAFGPALKHEKSMDLGPGGMASAFIKDGSGIFNVLSDVCSGRFFLIVVVAYITS